MSNKYYCLNIQIVDILMMSICFFTSLGAKFFGEMATTQVETMDERCTKLLQLILHSPHEAEKFLAEIINSDNSNCSSGSNNTGEWNAIVVHCLNVSVECGNLAGVKLLLPHCSQDGSHKLLLSAMQCKRHLHTREVLQILIDRGIKLDSSDASYNCLLDYVFRDLQNFRSSSHRGNRDWRNITSLNNLFALAVDLKLLLERGGADLTLPQVLNNQTFCAELERTVLNSETIGRILLRFFLDQGFDPNFKQLTNPPRISLLVTFLDQRNWGAASLLIEYGAMPPPSLNSNIRDDNDLQRYLDHFKDNLGATILQLRQGMERKLQRRKEIYPHHLKLALDPACNSHSSFDTSPLVTIISEYLL